MVSLFHVQLKVPLLIRSVDHAGTSNLSFSTDWGNAFSSAFRILNENSRRWLRTEFREMFSCTFKTVKVAFWPWTYTWRHSNENRDEKHQHLLSLLFQMRALCHGEVPRPPIPFSISAFPLAYKCKWKHSDKVENSCVILPTLSQANKDFLSLRELSWPQCITTCGSSPRSNGDEHLPPSSSWGHINLNVSPCLRC